MLGRGRGRKKGLGAGREGAAGLLGLPGGRTGPEEGRGRGARDRGVEEKTKFERTKVSARAIDPTGTIVGQLPFTGDAPTGESRIKMRRILEAAQLRARKVERQAIPLEHRDLVRRYQEALHAAVAGESESGGAEDEAPAGAGEETGAGASDGARGTSDGQD